MYTIEFAEGVVEHLYDVNETAERVIVRAVRRKRPHQTTEEIL